MKGRRQSDQQTEQTGRAILSQPDIRENKQGGPRGSGTVTSGIAAATPGTQSHEAEQPLLSQQSTEMRQFTRRVSEQQASDQ